MRAALTEKWRRIKNSSFGKNVLNVETMNFNSASHFFLGGALLMTALPMVFPISLAIYLAFTLSFLALSLAFKGLAKPPKNTLRSLLFGAAMVFSLALSAGMLLLMPSYFIALGFMFYSAATHLIANRFLNNPNNEVEKLSFWSKLGHILTSAAFLGAAVSFALGFGMTGIALPATFAFPLGIGLFAVMAGTLAWEWMSSKESKASSLAAEANATTAQQMRSITDATVPTKQTRVLPAHASSAEAGVDESLSALERTAPSTISP